MATQSEIDALVAEAQPTRIGDSFSQRVRDREYYERLLGEFVGAQDLGDREKALFQWLPRAASIAHQRHGSDGDWHYVQGPDGLFVEQKVKPLAPAVYWNGTAFEIVPFTGALGFWADDYVAFAQSVLDTAHQAGATTIIDLGSGASILTGYIAHEAAQRGIHGLRFVNIERDQVALAFGLHFMRSIEIEASHVLMDVAASLARPDHLKELKDRIGPGRALFLTHGGLQPFYTTQQCLGVFRYMLKEIGAVAGVHWELCGCRTSTYREAVKRFAEPPRLPQQYFDWPSDPIDLIASSASSLGIEIVTRMDIWPHFPNRFWPSLLTWRVDSQVN